LPTDDIVRLAAPDEKAVEGATNAHAWIFVFDIDRESDESPQPLKIVRRIATSEKALRYYAFIAAADKGIDARVIDPYRQTIGQRVISNWGGKS
jgi:hypothetical protein